MFRHLRSWLSKGGWPIVLTALCVVAVSGCGFVKPVLSPTPTTALPTMVAAMPSPAVTAVPTTSVPVDTPTVPATVAVPSTATVTTAPPAATKPPAQGVPAESLTATAIAPTIQAGQSTALAGGPATARAAEATAAAYATGKPPAGRFPTDLRLIVAWKDYPRGLMGINAHNFLGWATAPAADTDISVQEFGPVFFGNCTSDGAYLLWRKDTQKVYFLPRNTHGAIHAESCIDVWAEHADTWAAGQPNNEDLSAPAGKSIPRMGIGKVWRQSYYNASNPPRLDFALGPEQPGKALVQTFERGFILQRADNKHFYVFFNTFSYVTRGGNQTARVWIDVAP